MLIISTNNYYRQGRKQREGRGGRVPPEFGVGDANVIRPPRILA
jgi:hypothetical protein